MKIIMMKSLSIMTTEVMEEDMVGEGTAGEMLLTKEEWMMDVVLVA